MATAIAANTPKTIMPPFIALFPLSPSAVRSNYSFRMLFTKVNNILETDNEKERKSFWATYYKGMRVHISSYAITL